MCQFPSIIFDFLHKSPYNKNALRHEGRFSDKKVETFMKILLQVALVFGIYWVGQGIEAVLPFAFPASVISLLLLLVLLLTGVVRVDHSPTFCWGTWAFSSSPCR